jgi:glycosyltransferase involved in cell wall biosynthesis
MHSAFPLPTELMEWLADFRRRKGRPLRVLHLNNGVNNAYYNAKMLNAVGLECDVLCNDAYHIMACPEWEDAEFDGDLRNQHYPAWEKIPLDGFQRPKWFVQGPLITCHRYLMAKASGRRLAALYWWKRLTWERIALCCRERKEPIPRWLPELVSLPAGFQRVWGETTARAAGYLTSESPRNGWLGLRRPLYTGLAGLVFLTIAAVCFLRALGGLLAAVFRRSGEGGSAAYDFDRRKAELLRIFRDAFPDRSDQLTDAELEDYRGAAALWRELFVHYDIIHAYGTAPLEPMLADVPYLALEAGTLRNIPFAPSFAGRMTALSYRLADHVFVTNFDCLENARQLAPGRVSLITHPFPEDHGKGVKGWEGRRAQLCRELNADFLIFFPTRHDWVPGTGDAEKGNDVFLKAFCRLRRQGLRIGMVCCRWGHNVAQSMRLLEEGEAADAVRWLPPLGTRAFERMVKACDLVADQFKLGAFGGIFFKSLAVGAAVCTRLDEEACRRHYGAAPPALCCASEEEIVEKLRAAYFDPQQLRQLAAAGRAWIKTHHRAVDTLQQQLEQYKAHLERHQSGTITVQRMSVWDWTKRTNDRSRVHDGSTVIDR